MLRTNSKKAKENIRIYIIQNTICDENTILYAYLCNYNHRVHGTVYEDQYGRLVDLFSLCAMYLYNSAYEQVIKHDYYFRKNGVIDEKAAFEYWLSGLPHEFTSEYFLGPIAKDIVRGLLEETEQEADRFTEYDAEKFLSHLIYREIKQEVNRQYREVQKGAK